MMEETTRFSLLAVMLQRTWLNQCTKNIPQHLFGAIHLVRTYLMSDFSTPSPCMHLHTFWMNPLSPLPPPFLQLCTLSIDGLFLNQKNKSDIRLPYSLQYKHSEKKFFTKKYAILQDEINIQGSSINQKLKEKHFILQVCIYLPSVFQSHTRPKIFSH